MIYEYVITIGEEVELVWKQRWTAANWLLMSVRWSLVVSPIITCIQLDHNVRPYYTPCVLSLCRLMLLV